LTQLRYICYFKETLLLLNVINYQDFLVMGHNVWQIKTSFINTKSRWISGKLRENLDNLSHLIKVKFLWNNKCNEVESFYLYIHKHNSHIYRNVWSFCPNVLNFYKYTYFYLFLRNSGHFYLTLIPCFVKCPIIKP
jgi:hypothetical protein